MRKKITNQNEIIDYYKVHHNITKCANKFNLCLTTIRKILKSEKIDTSKRKPNIEEILIFYNKGNSLNSCKRKFKISTETIKNLAGKNIIIRDKYLCNKSLFCNDNYFNKIDTNSKAYFLGLLVADGWNSGNGFAISLLKIDSYILEKFKKDIKYTGDILSYTNKTSINKNKMCTLKITSKKVIQDLEKWGLIKAKTHYTYFPDIPEEFHSHFIRGVFDGDGCITLHKKTNQFAFSIIGNINLIKTIQEILIKKCNLNSNKLHKRKDCKNNIVSLNFGGNKQIKKIENYLYKDCDDLFLKRKKEKFDANF